MSGVWPSRGYYVAECPDAADDHVAPDEHCTCGIYAARDRKHLSEMAYGLYYHPDDVRVIGEVALAGKVIIATRGYRAERARITQLFVPYGAWKLVRSLEHYRVPISLTNPFDE
ncbi:MAG: hypothetical protein ABR529_11725 [Actinomycetota bacterium]